MNKYIFFNTEDNNQIIELNSKKLIFFSLAIIFIIVVGSIVGAKIFTKHIYESKLDNIRANNKELSRTVKKAKRKISRMDTRVDSLIRKDKALRTYINIPSIDKDINEIGIGGKVVHKSKSMDDLLPGDTITVSTLMNDLNELERKIKLEKLSYQEIYNAFKDHSKRIKSTPSIRPVNRAAYISDDFGYRRDPFTRKKEFHYGVDYAAPRGTSVLVTADGVVRNTRFSPSFGKIITVDHSSGYTTIYAHLRNFSVNEGEKVSRGEKVGEIGDTGRTTGSHLHYEVRKYGMKKNPMKYYLTGHIRLR